VSRREATAEPTPDPPPPRGHAVCCLLSPSHFLPFAPVPPATTRAGDCGPVYAWMRTTYLHNGPDGQPTLQQAESVVHNSVLLTNWHGVWPIE